MDGMLKDHHSSSPLCVYRVASVLDFTVRMTCCTFQANKNPESRASRVAMGPSLAAAVCIMVCAVASALPLAKFFSFRYAAPVFLLARSTPTSFDPISVRSSTAADTKRGDADEQEDNIYDAGDDSDDSDEWGIIHAPLWQSTPVVAHLPVSAFNGYGQLGRFQLLLSPRCVLAALCSSRKPRCSPWIL